MLAVPLKLWNYDLPFAGCSDCVFIYSGICEEFALRIAVGWIYGPIKRHKIEHQTEATTTAESAINNLCKPHEEGKETIIIKIIANGSN